MESPAWCLKDSFILKRRRKRHRFQWVPRQFNSIFTARKRSLGQGNIFIGMCQEFCSQGGSAPGGVSAPGEGWCLVETPPGRLLLRAVRILLECILVIFISIEQRQRSKTIFALALIKRNRNAITKMHSSRMHTIRCSGRLLDGRVGGVCPGGCLPRGVSTHGDGICQVGVCQTPPPLNRITDRCENITLPQLRCGR